MLYGVLKTLPVGARAHYVTLTHETSPEGEVVLVAHCVYDGQGVEDLLEYE